VENAIPAWVRFGAVVTHRDDLPAVQKWRSTRNARITAFESSSASAAAEVANERYAHKMGPQALAAVAAKLGPVAYLDDLFGCPDEVRAVLLREVHLYDGLAASDKDASVRFHEAGVAALLPGRLSVFTPDASLMSYSGGAYGSGEKGTSRRALREAEVTPIRGDPAAVAHERARLEEAQAGEVAAAKALAGVLQELAAANAELAAVGDDRNRLDNLRRDLVLKVGKQTAAEGEVARARASAESAAGRHKELVKLEARLRAAQGEQQGWLARVPAAAAAQAAARLRLGLAEVAVVRAEEERKRLEEALSAGKLARERAERDVKSAKALLLRLTQERNEAAAELKANTARVSKTWGGRHDAYFQDLPISTEELLALVQLLDVSAALLRERRAAVGPWDRGRTTHLDRLPSRFLT
jgi:hypothetical protein